MLLSYSQMIYGAIYNSHLRPELMLYSVFMFFGSSVSVVLLLEEMS